MKSLWKFSAIAAVAVSGSFAHADVVTSTAATGSELVLFVRDVSAGASPDRVYARGLGITLDDVLTSAAASGGTYSGPGQALSFSLPAIGPDSNLSTFLGAGTQFVWTIMAGDTVGTAANAQRYLTTTQTDLAASGATLPSNSAVRTVWSGISAMLTDLNGALPDPAGSSTTTNGQWGQSGGAYEGATTWFGGGLQNENALGQAANLFVLTNSSTSNLASARVYAALDVVLEANGALHTVSVGQVPLPPALLLLGSAFAGLAGVARRKRSNDVVAA
jgi:hypothetical protein